VAAPPVGYAHAVASSLSVGVLLVSTDGVVRWANDAARALLGSAAEAPPPAGGSPATDTPALVDRRVAAELPLRAGQRRELCWRSPDGQYRWLEVECRGLDRSGALDPANGTGAAAGEGTLVLQVLDVTARHELAERARQREHRLARVEALAQTGSWEWQVATKEVDWSGELRRMCGIPPGSDLDYAGYCALVHPDDVGPMEQAVAEALRGGQPFRCVHRMRPRDGGRRVFESYGEVVPDEDGRPARMVVTVRDVTDQAVEAGEFAGLGEHDSLTGVLDRRATVAVIRERLASGARGGALLLVDLDGFKDVNALRGHSVGDQVMRGLAELLRERADPRAVLGRLGGDEFAVLLRSGNAGDALDAAESLCAAVADHRFPTDAGAVRVTASIGVAPLAPAGDCDVLLANADLALREAKSAGRNQARVFAPEQYELAVRRVSVLQRVHNALDRGLMRVEAQPIVDLATRKVSSYELLVRMRDGLDPPLGPAEFLPAVERTELVHRLDRWMVEQAVDALASPRGRRERLHLHVNVSAPSLEDPRFGDYVVSTLRAADVEPARLGLEITETAALTNLTAARRLANRLTRAGCRFALDDFGAGFGSFAYLKHLPFTSVKIDGEFVRQADRARGDTVFVEAVVTVARGLNIATVAEYVDREQLVTTLTRLGVDRGQGYHLGRPRPLAEVVGGRRTGHG
jgi:diguanylate cyclase (GGDEF)-like protein